MPFIEGNTTVSSTAKPAYVVYVYSQFACC